MSASNQGASNDNSNSSDSKSSSIKGAPNPLSITTASVIAGTVQEDTVLAATGQLAAADSNTSATLTWGVKGDAKDNYGSLSVDGTGKWTYTLNSNSDAVQSLAAGESHKDTFTIQVKDSKGASASQQVTITVTGTNDVPVIAHSTINSRGDGNGSSGKASGAVSFNDVDRGDTHTATVTMKPLVASSGTPNLSSYLQNAIHTSIIGEGDNRNGGDNANSSGSAKWDFTLPANFPTLATGQSALATYQMTVSDNHSGVSGSQDISVLIVGTGAAPKVYAVAAQARLTEIAGIKDSLNLDNASGILSGNDLSLDGHSAITSSLAMTNWSAGGPVPSSVTPALAGALSASAVAATQHEDGGKSLSWNFTAPDKTFDFLAAGETLTLAYRVASSKDRSSQSEIITVTVTGTDDIPVITSSAQTGAVTEDSSPPPTANGSVSFTDVDLGDKHAVSVAAATGNTTSLGALSLGAMSDATGGATGTQAWTYSLDNTKADYLGAGDSVTETYNITVNDGHGGTVTQPVTITINGTNEPPAVSTKTQAASVTETTISADILSTNGHFTYTDVDTSDSHTVSIMNPADPIGTLAATDTNGTVGWSYSVPNSSIQYLAAGQQLAQTFTVQVDDHHGGIATTAVTVTISGTNEAPTVSAAVTGAATVNGVNSTLNALTHASDVDNGTTLTVANVPSILPAGVSYKAADSTFTLDPSNATYQSLAQGATTTVSLSYSVSDGIATTPASASWTVTGVSHAAAPVAVNDLVTTGVANAVMTLDLDTDIDWSANLDPSLGTAYATTEGYVLYDSGPNQYVEYTSSYGVSYSNCVFSYDGTLTLTRADGGEFALASAYLTNFNGESFTVTGYDHGKQVIQQLVSGNADMNNWGSMTEASLAILSDPAWQHVDKVDFSNNDPSATDILFLDNVNLDYRANVTANQNEAIDFNVLANDQGTGIAVAGFSMISAYGAAISLNADGTLHYDPTGSAKAKAVPAGATANDTFAYTIKDAQGLTSTDATVTVALHGVNDAPVAHDVSGFTTNEDTPLTILAATLLANVTDVDQPDTKTLVSVAGAQHGTVTLQGGNPVYTPKIYYNGADSFTYTVVDSAGAASSATVGVTINSVNNAPVVIAPLPGAISYWTADTNTADLIGTNNGTSYTGDIAGHFNTNGIITYASGHTGAAFSFNGAYHAVNVSVADTLHNDFTITGWIDTTSAGHAGSQFYQGSQIISAGQAANSFGVAVINNKLVFGINDFPNNGQAFTTIQSQTPVTTGNWIEFAAVRQGGTISLYIDGTLEATANSGYTGPIYGNSIIFGGGDVSNMWLAQAPTYNGLLDDVAFYNRALSSAEIQSVAQGQTAMTTPENNSLKINTVRIADVDAGSNSLQVSLAVSHGSLTLSSTSGLTMVGGNGGAALSFSGSQSAIDAALASGLTFTPAAGYVGADKITISADDLGNSGAGGPLSSIQTVDIVVVGTPGP